MNISRREFLASAVAAPFARQAAPERLNILLVTNDQHRADCLGCYGNPVIRTPRVDRLAAEGVRFSGHFVQAPQCVPSRSALHTGRYPHVNRAPSNRFRLPDSEATLARILAGRGYTAATVGEMPFAPTKHLAGFAEVVASDPEYDAFLEKNGWRGKGLSPAASRLVDVYREKSARRFQAAPVPWPEELDETAFYAEAARRFLRAGRNQPFFLHVNFRRPHHPFDPPAPFDSMYLGAKFPAPHKREGEMEGKPPAQAAALRSSVGFDLTKMTAEDLARITAYYYGMISLNDKYVGEILDELRALGLESRTLVVFNSDHGEMLGDHGLLFKGSYFYDEVVRVPLILRLPGRLPAGRVVDALVQEVDVLPTILDLAGIEAPRGVQGRSLVPLVAQLAPGRTAVFSEFPTIKMARTRSWKLVHYVRASHGELYDLERDPHELFNRYDDPAFASARSEMQHVLTDWLIQSDDPKLAPIEAESRS